MVREVWQRTFQQIYIQQTTHLLELNSGGSQVVFLVFNTTMWPPDTPSPTDVSVNQESYNIKMLTSKQDILAHGLHTARILPWHLSNLHLSLLTENTVVNNLQQAFHIKILITSWVKVLTGILNAPASPKSASFNAFVHLSISRFCGFRSRCRTLCEWQ